MLKEHYKKLKLRRKSLIKDAGGPWRVVLTSLAIFILSQLVAAILAGALLAITHPGAQLNDIFNSSASAQFIYILFVEALAASLVFLLVRRRKLGLGFIGLGRRPKLNDLWRALGALIIFFTAVLVANIVISFFWPHLNQTQDLGFNNLVGKGDNILAFVALVILPPLGEEPLVRGYLFSGLRTRLSYKQAMLITSLLFGIAHLQLGSGNALVVEAGVDTFILSLVLVHLRQTTGALYAGILVHMLNNAVAFGVKFH